MAGISPSRGIPLVRIDAGTGAAIAAGAVREYNIVAASQAGPVKDRIPPRVLRGTLRGHIEDIVLYWQTSASSGIPVGVYFWANDSQNTSALGTIHLLGMELVSGAEWTAEVAAGIPMLRAHVGGLEIPYVDEDNTGEFHFSLENDSTTTALAAGSYSLEFGYRPEFPA